MSPRWTGRQVYHRRIHHHCLVLMRISIRIASNPGWMAPGKGILGFLFNLSVESLIFVIPPPFSKPSFNDMLEEDRSSSWKITVGIHPKHASRYSEQDWQAMLRHLTHSRVVGIREVGLDFSVPSRHWDKQEALFERILNLGTMGHVLVMHLRGEPTIPKGASYTDTRFA